MPTWTSAKTAGPAAGLATGLASHLACLACSAAALALSAPALAAEDTATTAWLRDGQVQLRALASNGAPTVATNALTANDKVPLGSLWKLFVYAYLADTHAQEAAYQCAANSGTQSNGEERYCCDPGEQVQRDAALARSCAPYFAPERLGLGAKAWQSHWQTRTPSKWLLDLQALQPQTEVDVGDLLQALASISPQARAQARSALLQTGLEGYGREAWTRLGTGLRYKTYSWHRADGSAFGGAAGWLADGTPFWFGARGSSRTTLTKWAAPLAAALPEPRWQDAGHGADDTSCVDVDFFERYPLRAVLQERGTTPARTGDLNGRYRLQFTNGNWLSLEARGSLALTQSRDAVPHINGRFSVNDYVARVVDREGNAKSPQAARALAIAARSYLVQNAHFDSGCWHIADASTTQRVSPNPPTSDALAAAWFTDELVLTGVPVHYHTDAPAPNRMAVREALAHADAGWDFEHILTASYPRATLGTLQGRLECARLDSAEQWLAQAAARWQSTLRREPGFEALQSAPRICALADGHPYSDQRRMRIYVRGWRSLDERVTLAHEYLHLALRFHPNGANEDYVERLARRLIEG